MTIPEKIIDSYLFWQNLRKNQGQRLHQVSRDIFDLYRPLAIPVLEFQLTSSFVNKIVCFLLDHRIIGGEGGDIIRQCPPREIFLDPVPEKILAKFIPILAKSQEKCQVSVIMNTGEIKINENLTDMN